MSTPAPEATGDTIETGLAPELAAVEAALSEDGDIWIVPPFQPSRVILSAAFIAGGFAMFGYLLLSFWSSPALGIHDRVVWPAYALLTGAMVVTLAGVRVGLSVWSPHAKLGLTTLGILAAAAVGIGGARFVLYTAVGTRNPPFTLNLKVGDRFPAYSLPDQIGVTHSGPVTKPGINTLIVIYRGDFCPFARFELGELTKNLGELTGAGLDVVAISADPVDRSQMLAKFLRTPIPLLSDEHETVLGPLGLVRKHRDSEPDDAIPAFFILDQTGVVRWIFTSPYYRDMPTIAAILEASRKISSAQWQPTTSPR